MGKTVPCMDKRTKRETQAKLWQGCTRIS
jgi:hypothetical protein